MRKNSWVWVWQFDDLGADDGIRFTNHVTGKTSLRYGYSPEVATKFCGYLNSRG